MMALVGVTPALMKPTALSLNILVASIATYQFYRAGCFSWSLFWPFALLSVPLTVIVKIWLENTKDLRWVAILLDKAPPADPVDVPDAIETVG